ncbi:S-adenosylmethionine--tRNA ribosyltransferase-isomerase [Thermanaeromonas toyohensis ToBE]|uniref:S-adenosylmethionine:tRNA ribosyltransferase-isomerase n=1 Tax=Thermanaeromonas toyohensis ToBE TaxID=698762 RepID=A0A1W1VZS6_9FIRM|nr:tRNA preQ1(34) S-adenosylmethionine ribosyltransferase-isomerase QueA [Thermanaeromonas toyohensis]SMB98855.1 S-adenosylmethionine--tRNA ribosyltransferase-isomerase [Thermanaeromonas toyohensis ToBE]
MRVEDFDYYLPPELIAQHPVEPRDASRLLVLHRKAGMLEHRRFYELPLYLKPGDILVLNDTRVIPARLLGKKAETGGQVELLLLRPLRRDCWEALVRPGRRIPPGTELLFGQGELRAKVLERTPQGGRLVEFKYEGEWEEILGRLGEVPLPPYIKEKLPDPERYQTVYASRPGSVAAPTAGLHFTPRLLKELKEKGVKIVYILLHVGLGTFRPVKEEVVEKHRMHAEYFCVDPEAARTINEARRQGGRVIAVGTTVVRTLETAATPEGEIKPREGLTELFIYPGYRFKAVDGLITNFHLPRSTLLMLVCAFAGRERVLEAYQVAIKERYRFYSFGDAMLIL